MDPSNPTPMGKGDYGSHNKLCTLKLCPIEYSIFQYRPSLAANATFLALFSIFLFIHLGLGFRFKSWWYSGCMIAGCASNIAGYGARVLLWSNPFSFIGFLIQIIFIGSAPVFYSAAIYVTLAKIVEELDVSLSRIKPKLYYVIFIVCDVGSLVLQAAGGAISSTSDGDGSVGVNLALGGLVFQVVTIIVFCGLLVDYLVRYFKGIPSSSISRQMKLFIGFLSSGILLILGRCAYRVAELSEGYNGTLFHNQNLFIGLEGVLIVLAVTSLCIGHPGFVFDSRATYDKTPSLTSSREGVESGIELMTK